MRIAPDVDHMVTRVGCPLELELVIFKDWKQLDGIDAKFLQVRDLLYVNENFQPSSGWRDADDFSARAALHFWRGAGGGGDAFSFSPAKVPR